MTTDTIQQDLHIQQNILSNFNSINDNYNRHNDEATNADISDDIIDSWQAKASKLPIPTSSTRSASSDIVRSRSRGRRREFLSAATRSLTSSMERLHQDKDLPDKPTDRQDRPLSRRHTFLMRSTPVSAHSVSTPEPTLEKDTLGEETEDQEESVNEVKPSEIPVLKEKSSVFARLSTKTTNSSRLKIRIPAPEAASIQRTTSTYRSVSSPVITRSEFEAELTPAASKSVDQLGYLLGSAPEHLPSTPISTTRHNLSRFNETPKSTMSKRFSISRNRLSSMIYSRDSINSYHSLKSSGSTVLNKYDISGPLEAVAEDVGQLRLKINRLEAELMATKREKNQLKQNQHQNQVLAGNRSPRHKETGTNTVNNELKREMAKMTQINQEHTEARARCQGEIDQLNQRLKTLELELEYKQLDHSINCVGGVDHADNETASIVGERQHENAVIEEALFLEQMSAQEAEIAALKDSNQKLRQQLIVQPETASQSPNASEELELCKRDNEAYVSERTKLLVLVEDLQTQLHQVTEAHLAASEHCTRLELANHNYELIQSTLREKNQSLESKSKLIKSENEKRIQTINDDLTTSREKLATVLDQRDRLVAHNLRLQKILENVKTALQDRERELQLSHDEVRTLRALNVSSESERTLQTQHYQTTIDSLSKQVVDLEAERGVEALRARSRPNLDADYDRLQNRVKVMEVERDTAVARAAARGREELAQLEIKIRKLAETNDQLSSQSQTLMKDNGRQKRYLNRFEFIVEDLKISLEQRDMQVEELKHSLAKVIDTVPEKVAVNLNRKSIMLTGAPLSKRDV